MWAATAVAIAIYLMTAGQWPLALAVAVIGGAGYVAARSVDDILAKRVQAAPAAK
jgi:hypothetical protein